MEVIGLIKKIGTTEEFGNNGFKKREFVVLTAEDYPQMLSLELTQDKTGLIDSYKEGDSVKVSINLRGREWINPQGEAKYFIQLSAWRIEKV